MKTTCTIWAVLGIAFVIMVMSGWVHWERARANESIPEDGPVDANDCLVLYSTAPLRITSESLWEEDWTINITGSRPITIVCDGLDITSDIDGIHRTIQAMAKVLIVMGKHQLINGGKIDEIHAALCAPDPNAFFITATSDIIAPVEGYLRWDHDGDEDLEIYTGSEWISTGVEHENM